MLCAQIFPPEKIFNEYTCNLEEDIESFESSISPDDELLYELSKYTLCFKHPFMLRRYNSHLGARRMLYAKILSIILMLMCVIDLFMQGPCALCFTTVKIVVIAYSFTIMLTTWSLPFCSSVQQKIKGLEWILYGLTSLSLTVIMFQTSYYKTEEIIPEYAIVPPLMAMLFPFGGVTVHVNFIVIVFSQILSLFGTYFFVVVPFRKFSQYEHASGSPLIMGAVLLAINLTIITVTYNLMKNNVHLYVIYQKYRTIQTDSLTEKAEELKRSYIAQTLHDIGTPMNTLTLGLDLLKGSPLTQEQYEIVETCQCSVEMMSLTRRKAMDYANYRENETLRPMLSRVNVRELLHNKCKRIMSGFNDGGGVDMQFIVHDGVADFIISDSDWLWEMLSNFLSNAKKFTYNGHIITELRLTPDRRNVLFEVRDTGIGIPGKKKSALFRPFSQLQRGAGGTGLGLYGVKVKSELLGGTCGVRDNTIDRVGTVFWFSIPYKPDLSEREMEVESVLVQNSSFLHSGPRSPGCSTGPSMTGKGQCNTGASASCSEQNPVFLYVEDSAVMRKLVVTSLQKLGIMVEVACDGEEALMKLKKKVYALVLIDLGLPKVSGLQVLIQLRSFEDHVRRERQPAAIVSGTVVQKEVDEALSAGADFFLPKPVTAEQVMKVYEEVQRRKFEMSPPTPRSAPKNCSVLVIEDENSTRKFLVKILEKFGYSVKSAKDGAEGLLRLQEQEYFVVFCDLNMPVMDGFECVNRFRQWEAEQHRSGSTGVKNWRTEHQTIYALSAAATDMDKQHALKMGMDQFLEKPIKIARLQQVLEALEQSRKNNEMAIARPNW